MFPTDFFIFLQIILFMFITPGPPRVVIVSHTLNYGLSRSIWTALGDVTANLIWDGMGRGEVGWDGMGRDGM